MCVTVGVVSSGVPSSKLQVNVNAPPLGSKLPAESRFSVSDATPVVTSAVITATGSGFTVTLTVTRSGLLLSLRSLAISETT